MGTMTADTSNSTKLPSAARRGGAALLTVGFIGSSLTVGAHATTDPVTGAPEDQSGVLHSQDDEDQWNPEPAKHLLDGSDNETTGVVFPGQSLKYEVQIDLSNASDIDYIEGLGIEDQLPAGFEADTDSIEIYDSELGAVGESSALVSADAYEVEVTPNGTLRIGLNQDWIDKNITDSEDPHQGRLIFTFNVTVTDEAEARESIFTGEDGEVELLHNQVYQFVDGPAAAVYETDEDEDGNETQTQTNVGETERYLFGAADDGVHIPEVNPEAEVLDSDGEAVGGRIAVGGDRVQQSVDIDANWAGTTVDDDGYTVVEDTLGTAVGVSEYGLVDSVDTDVVVIDEDSVQVHTTIVDGNTGERVVNGTVTDSFEISAGSGELSVLLSEDSSLLEQINDEGADFDFRVTYDLLVQDVEESATAQTDPTQLVEGNEYSAEGDTSFSVQAIAPEKEAGLVALGENEDGETAGFGSFEALGSIETDTEFFYRLGSSSHPANALNPVAEWSVLDEYTSGDRALHEDLVAVADTAVHDVEGEEIIAAGSDITEHFSIRPSGDSYVVQASEEFLELVSADVDNENSWSVYVGAHRTAGAENRVSNTSYEVRNGFDRGVTVTTGTEAASEEEGEEEVEEETELVLSAPAEAEQGETIEVSGSGFTPEGEVTVSLNPELGGFIADEDGEFSGELTIPEDAETGERELTAFDVASEESVSSAILITEATTEDESEGNGEDEGEENGSTDEEESGSSDEEESGSTDEQNGSSTINETDTSGGGSGSGSEDESGPDAETVNVAASDRDGSGDQDSDPESSTIGTGDGPGTSTWDGSGGTGDEREQQLQADEQLSVTGATSPWLIGGGALVLMLAGGAALAFNRLRTVGSVFGGK